MESFTIMLELCAREGDKCEEALDLMDDLESLGTWLCIQHTYIYNVGRQLGVKMLFHLYTFPPSRHETMRP